MPNSDAFSIDKMIEAVRRMEEVKPVGGFIRNLTLGPGLPSGAYNWTQREKPDANLWGIPVRQSTAFPMTVGCAKCNGSGYGEESTYCPQCAGAGEIRYEGLCQNDRGYIMLTSKLPRKAYPKWPESVPVPLRKI